jgi:hypothetical protein
MNKLALLSLVLLFGCARPAPRVTAPPVPLPPLPPVRKSLTAPVSPFAGKVARSITLAWNNYGPMPEGAAWVTGVNGSTNLIDWYEITNMPYSGTVTVTLYARPNPEFYRAFNRDKP